MFALGLADCSEDDDEGGEGDGDVTYGTAGFKEIEIAAGERQPGDSTGSGQQRTLRQELAHDPAARGSQRQPDGDLALASKILENQSYTI